MNNRLIKSNDAGGGGACTNTVDLYNPFPDGGGVALYQLNGDATDVSGNYDGTATNVTYGTGQFGQAGVFNGSSSYVGMATNSWNSLTSYTASFWIYDTGTATGGRTMVSNYGYTAASNVEKGWIIMRVGTKLRISNATTGLASTYLSTNDIPFNQWAHIVVTNTQSEIKIYFNGVLDSTHTTNGFINDASWPMRPAIGVYRYETTETRNGYFNGSIDQVRIFSRALRPYEVEALYTEEYCTPTIVPSEHFNTVIYSGNGSTQSITGVGFEPDLVWAKRRSSAEDNVLFDSVRGVQNQLVSNKTNAESTKTNALSSFDSDGFTTGDNNALNTSGQTYVAWNFKAGGAAVTNTDGTITSQVSANTEAGFSVVSYTGNNSTGTVGHGLGVAPKIAIIKKTDSTDNWQVSISNITGVTGHRVYLNLTQGISQDLFRETAKPSSTVLSIGGQDCISQGYIAYCFAEVEGFSNFGSYVGTGTANSNVIVTGFEPAFVMIKKSSGTSRWRIWDNKRDLTNPRSHNLFPEDSIAETGRPTHTTQDMNFLENGFEIPSGQDDSINGSGDTFIYMAFAADPTAVEPTLEDSFNTVTYTGNSSTNRQVTGVGFQPDFVWIKNRDRTSNNSVFDEIRGATKFLAFNLSDSEQTYTDTLTSFDSDGFTVSNSSAVNQTGEDITAWCWKGAELPAINSNGSIPSVVSANPAAGFSIVNWRAGSTIGNVGHSLNATPDMIIVKQTDGIQDWWTWHNIFTGNQALKLNTLDATINNPNIFGGSDVPNITTFAFNGSSGADYVAYCFSQITGFSKFGSYTGNLSSQTDIDCGFEPAFVMIKCSSGFNSGDWVIYDKNNPTSNPKVNPTLIRPYAEQNATLFGINFTANGFNIPTTCTTNSVNQTGYTYIYMAFANQF